MYFSYKLKQEVIELYWNTALYNLAINLTYIFEPIFLFNLGFGLIRIMAFYLMVYAAYALLILPVTKLTARIGYKHAIFISTIIYVLYWTVLYQIKFHTILIFLAPVLFALQKSFFWPPYNADVAISNVKKQRGREIGVLFSVVELVAIVGPIIGGFISYQFGFSILFAAAAFLMIASVFPLLLSPEIYNKHRFHFRNLWGVAKKYPYNFFGYWGYAEDLMLMSLWPLYIYAIIPAVFSVGVVITVASLIAIVVMLYLGKLIDRFSVRKFLPVTAVAYGFSWLIRFFSASVPGVVVFDTLTRLGKAAVNVPLLSQTFELAGERGSDYAIAYAVFFEFSLAVGKVVAALAAIWILAATGNIYYVFVVAGGMTMLYSLVKKK
jgi:MFS family permease